MQFVIAFSCLLAVASAGYLGNYGGAYAAGYAHHGSHAVAYNAPLVSAPHPIAHAYAAPLAHSYAAPLAYAHHGSHAVPYNAPLVSAPHPIPVAHAYAHGYATHAVAPIAHAVAAPLAHAHPVALASEARLVDPIAIAAGAPLPTGDTVEVAAAKAAHFQAHHAAKSGHYLGKRSPGYLSAGYGSHIAYAAPVHSYSYAAPIATSHSYSHVVSPLGYSAHSGYGYGGHVSPYYG